MANYYFDNDAITEAILKYQKKLREEGVRDASIIEPYVDQIYTLIRIVIASYKIGRFYEDIKELEQEAFLAILESLERVDPSKGLVFNYFSFVVKNHLKAWTQRLNKTRYVTREYDAEHDGDNDEELHLDIDDNIMSDIINYANSHCDEYVAALIKETVSIISEEMPTSKLDLIETLRKRGYAYTMIRKVMKVIRNALTELGNEHRL